MVLMINKRVDIIAKETAELIPRQHQNQPIYFILITTLLLKKETPSDKTSG